MDWSAWPSAVRGEGLRLLANEWFPAGAAAVVGVLLVTLIIVTAKYYGLRRRAQSRDLGAEALARAVIASRAVRAKLGNRTSAQVQAAGPTAAENVYCHVKIYVDHSTLARDWENANTRAPNIDWPRLPKLLLDAFSRLPVAADKVLVYCGANVYGSFFNDSYYDLLDSIHNGTQQEMLPFRRAKRGQLKAKLMSQAPAGGKDAGEWADRKAHEAIAAETQAWRAENAITRELLANQLNRIFGYIAFPVERRTPPNLRTADYTADGVPLAPEKRVDTQLCTDLIADAVYDLYEVAILVGNDVDFVPAIDFVREELGKKIVHVGLRQYSSGIRPHCHASIDLREIMDPAPS